MPNYRILWVQVVLLICVIGFPGDLAAQDSDSTVWYSGTSVFAEWATGFQRCCSVVSQLE